MCVYCSACDAVLLVFNQNVHLDAPAAVQEQCEYFQEAGGMPAALWKAQLDPDSSAILHTSGTLESASASHPATVSGAEAGLPLILTSLLVSPPCFKGESDTEVLQELLS